MTAAKEIFAQLRTKNQSVPVDIRKAVYRNAIRYGDEDDWEFFRQRYQTIQVASENNLVLGALTSTRDIWLIERLIWFSLDSKLIRPSDTVTVWISLSLNYYARQSIWKAIRYNWDLLTQRYGDDTEIASLSMALH